MSNTSSGASGDRAGQWLGDADATQPGPPLTAPMERLIRAVDRVLSTYREHWRAGEDVIVEVEAQELAVARDEIGIPE